MRQRLVFCTAAACVAAGTSFATAAPAATVTPTAIVNLSPVTASGALATGYTVTKHLLRGHCETGTISTGNGYRCFAGKTVLDPCWVTSSKKYVDCLAQPWAYDVVQLKVSKGYSNYGGVQAKADLPWGVQLAGGTRCLRIQGTPAFIDGQVQTYRCPRTRYVLTGNQYKSTKVWKIREAKKVAHGYKEIGKVRIATAWFGKKSREA